MTGSAAPEAGAAAFEARAGTVLVIQNEDGDPLGPLAQWLSVDGLRLQICRPYAGDALPADLDGLDGLVVLGGAMGAADDTANPWLPAVRRLLSDGVAREVPILGICLGAQLLALAMGGQVGRNPDGPEYGAQLIAKRANTATDPLFAELPITPDVIQWHVDAILELPLGAIHLASSPTCDVQAFRLGRLAWGIQFHIETTPALLRSWAMADAAELLDYDTAAILERAARAHEDVSAVWRPFAAAFAAIAIDPSSVPSARPIRVSTAAPITDPAAIRAALASELQHSRTLPWPDIAGRESQ